MEKKITYIVYRVFSDVEYLQTLKKFRVNCVYLIDLCWKAYTFNGISTQIKILQPDNLRMYDNLAWLL